MVHSRLISNRSNNGNCATFEVCRLLSSFTTVSHRLAPTRSWLEIPVRRPLLRRAGVPPWNTTKWELELTPKKTSMIEVKKILQLKLLIWTRKWLFTMIKKNQYSFTETFQCWKHAWPLDYPPDDAIWPSTRAVIFLWLVDMWAWS